MKNTKRFALLLSLGILAVLLSSVSFAEGELSNGYYLIRSAWTLADIRPGEAFEQNPNDSSEYMLDTILQVGDSFKVVQVKDNAILRWFPEGTGNEYQVNENTPSGDVRIYFRPVLQHEWEKFFWVEKKYEINILTGLLGGSVSASHVRAPRGEMITLNNSSETGYALDHYIVVKESSGTVDVENGKV